MKLVVHELPMRMQALSGCNDQGGRRWSLTQKNFQPAIPHKLSSVAHTARMY